MAMRENIRNIEDVQKASLELKKQKEAERLKRQEEKENKKRLEYDTKEFLRKEFERYIYQIGTCYTDEFYSIERKKQIFEDLKENLLIKKSYNYKNGEQVEFYNDKEVLLIREFFNKYYYKILKEVNNEKKLDEQYSFWNECKNFEPEPEKKEINYSYILKIILCIVFFPIIFLVAIIFAATKNIK